MTWSIVAHDATTGHTGVAVASRFFAVGAMCPHVSASHGALSTQALMNPLFGPRGLERLSVGFGADEVVKGLLENDEGRDQRQFHCVDAQGLAAAYTGSACVDWCGHRTGPGLSVAGNMLAGPDVVARTFETFQARGDLPLGRRLLVALKAGEDAGGDKRGKQSAALIVHRGEVYPALDIRSDDHPEPIDDLFRLYEVAHQRFVPFSKGFATALHPSGTFDRKVIETTVETFTAAYAADPAKYGI